MWEFEGPENHVLVFSPVGWVLMTVDPSHARWVGLYELYVVQRRSDQSPLLLSKICNYMHISIKYM